MASNRETTECICGQLTPLLRDNAGRVQLWNMACESCGAKATSYCNGKIGWMSARQHDRAAAAMRAAFDDADDNYYFGRNSGW